MGDVLNYTVFDIETTGLSKYTNSLTEIAAIKVRKGEISEKYQTLINPRRHIPSFITRLTGINDEMVEEAPFVEEVLPSLKSFFGKDVLVGHSVSFDMGFVSHKLQKYLKQDLNNKTVCTAKLARRIPMDFPNKKLGTLCEHFNIKNERAHRAMGDTMATLELLQKFRKILSYNKVHSIEDVHLFSNKSARKCRDGLILPRIF